MFGGKSILHCCDVNSGCYYHVNVKDGAKDIIHTERQVYNVGLELALFGTGGSLYDEECIP